MNPLSVLKPLMHSEHVALLCWKLQLSCFNGVQRQLQKKGMPNTNLYLVLSAVMHGVIGYAARLHLCSKILREHQMSQEVF